MTTILEITNNHAVKAVYCHPVYLTLFNQPWVFFGRNDAEAETPVLWPPYAKS